MPDNGATKSATHFSKLLDRKIGESNVSIVELSDKKTQQCCTIDKSSGPRDYIDNILLFMVARCAPRIT